MAQVILKAGRVRPVWAGHPWVFPQGIAETRGQLSSGCEVEVMDGQGNSLGRGLYAEGSAIAVRLYTRQSGRRLDRDLFVERIRAALELRALHGLGPETATTGYRLLHGEGDGLPGLVVDRFGDTLVVQFGTPGLVQRCETVVAALVEVLQPRCILDRTTDATQRREGFVAPGGCLHGEAPDSLVARERGLLLTIPLSLQQKTGYYFDQRPLRARIEEMARGRRVLDSYSYVGAIGMSAARGGAREVLCVDSSQPALDLGAALAQQNGLELQFRRKKALDFYHSTERRWDLVVADPPKLAQSRAGLDKALRAFQRVCAGAISVTESGGWVVVSSCSSALGIDQVERCLAVAGREQDVALQVVERIFQGPDHPVLPAFPEGLYLSTAIAMVRRSRS